MTKPHADGETGARCACPLVWMHTTMEFVWDEARRDSNMSKPGVDLALGRRLLDGRRVHNYQSPRGDGARWVLVGAVEGRFIAAVWTRRGAWFGSYRPGGREMRKSVTIVSMTGEEIDRMLADGGGRSDWARVDAMSQEEVDRLADEEDGPLLEG